MAKINAQNKAYTDFLLAACLCHYKHASVYLLTADLRALPCFFDRTHVPTSAKSDVKTAYINSAKTRRWAARVFWNEKYHLHNGLLPPADYLRAARADSTAGCLLELCCKNKHTNFGI
jgi:hypothetical protein